MILNEMLYITYYKAIYNEINARRAEIGASCMEHSIWIKKMSLLIIWREKL